MSRVGWFLFADNLEQWRRGQVLHQFPTLIFFASLLE